MSFKILNFKLKNPAPFFTKNGGFIQHHFPQRFKNSAGFTIIELLIVVAIIAMLTATVLVALGESRAKSRDTARVSDIKQIQNALQLYFIDNKVYPADYTTLSGIYIRAIPRDPRTGNAYAYSAQLVGSSCVDYHLGATLETVGAGTGVLSADYDKSAGASPCAGSAADFTGTDPIYDVRP